MSDTVRYIGATERSNNRTVFNLTSIVYKLYTTIIKYQIKSYKKIDTQNNLLYKNGHDGMIEKGKIHFG